MGGGEALAVLEGKHPLGVHTLRTRRCPVSAAVVSRRPEDRRRARSGSPAFLLALLSFLPCSRALQPSAARSRRLLQHPAHRAEPGKGALRGSLRPGGLGAGQRGRVLEVAVESGILISGGTSNRFHASGVSCQ